MQLIFPTYSISVEQKVIGKRPNPSKRVPYNLQLILHPEDKSLVHGTKCPVSSICQYLVSEIQVKVTIFITQSAYIAMWISYTYKFLRYVNFKDVTNPAFL